MYGGRRRRRQQPAGAHSKSLCHCRRRRARNSAEVRSLAHYSLTLVGLQNMCAVSAESADSAQPSQPANQRERERHSSRGLTLLVSRNLARRSVALVAGAPQPRPAVRGVRPPLSRSPNTPIGAETRYRIESLLIKTYRRSGQLTRANSAAGHHRARDLARKNIHSRTKPEFRSIRSTLAHKHTYIWRLYMSTCSPKLSLTI